MANIKEPDFKIIHEDEPEVVFSKVDPLTIIGYVAFTRFSGIWGKIEPKYDKNRDSIRLPFGLFESREQAVSQARDYFPQGCEIKIFKITL